jgi:hypothetical protein
LSVHDTSDVNKGIIWADNFTTDGSSYPISAAAPKWTGSIMTNMTAITSTLFTGDLAGNASTATQLASAGTITTSGDVSLTGGPYNYTQGGNMPLATTIADSVIMGKVLSGYTAGTAGAIADTDTILAAFEKLQASITATTGLSYEGAWTPGTDSTAGGNPNLRLSGKKVNGAFYICDADGTGTPNGDGTTPNSWKTGDWVIYVANGSATDEWQKLDQSNEVLGSGSPNQYTMWSGTNTIGTGVISQDTAATKTVTIGNSANLTVQGSTTLGDSNTDTTTFKGPGTFEQTARLKTGLALGTATDGTEYGTTGYALTSGGAEGNANTWTALEVGTVTSVALTETGDALTITGSPITSSGTINIAGAGAPSQYINGELNLVTFPALDNYVDWKLQGDSGINQDITKQTIVDFAGGTYISTATTTDTLTITHAATSRTDTTSTDTPAFGGTFEAITSVTSDLDGKGHVTAIDVSTITIPSLPSLDNYQSWTLAGDTGVDQTISSLNTANILGGTGIATVGSATDTLTINFDGTFPAAHGTQYSLPLWDTATTLGDSQISQNSLATEITATSSFKVTGKHLSVGGGTTKGLTVGGGGPSKAGFNFGTSVPSTNQDFVAKQGIHYSGRLLANSTAKVMATVADSTASSDVFGITARVYITSGIGSNAGDFGSVKTARIYDVACLSGQAPVFNKVIDSGYVGTGTLDVDFTAYTDGAATPKRGFTMSFTTNSATNSNFYITIEMLSARRASIVYPAS